jgi:DNA primase
MAALELRDLGIGKPASNGREMRFCCKQCGDADYKLYVNLNKGVYNCFKCGFKGHVKVDRDFIPIEARLTPVELPSELEPDSDTRFELGTESIIQRQGLQYWLRRGFTLEDANNFGILVNADRTSISIPVHDEYGEFKFYQERLLTPIGKKKYHFPHGAKVSQLLFGIHRTWNRDVICIVEGVMDAMAIGNSGVCMFGKQLHDAQLDILRKSPVKKILLWLDPDARAESFKAMNRLLPFFDVTQVVCDDQSLKDANDYLVKHGRGKLLSMLRLSNSENI